MWVREEMLSDREAVRAVNVAAFESELEADLVDALREQVEPLVSLVVEEDDMIVGHILFSPVSIENHPEMPLMGLAPMAVEPSRQGQGIGTAMLRVGLERCAELGAAAVVVLGHPAFYPRFGFVPASQYSIVSEYDAPDEAFMVLELQPGALDGVEGLVRFHPAFAEA